MTPVASPGALENAMGIGFTFGGQNFFGHGVYGPFSDEDPLHHYMQRSKLVLG
jgi:hypothetical protein